MSIDTVKSGEYKSTMSSMCSEYKPLLLPGINLPSDAFVRVVGYSKYEINIHGVVRRFKEQTIVPHYTGARGYATVTIIDDSGYRAPVKVHRLLALTFLPHPTDVDMVEVNHKDGNKKNFELHNLEWITASNNIIHSYENGLNTGESYGILCMHIATREITRYTSRYACAKFFNVSHCTLKGPLDNPHGIRPYKGYYLKYENDNRPWPEGDGSEINRYGTRAVLLKDIATGEVTRYKSMQDVGILLGTSTSSIFNQVTCEYPRPYKGYLMRRESDSVSWDTDGNCKEARRNSRISVTDIYTNAVTEYDSVTAFAACIDASTMSVYSAINRRSPFRHFLIKYI